jgi:hypothetical protein
MKLETYQITVDEYLKRLNHAVIRDEGLHKIIQLKNLKLVLVEALDNQKYIIQEVTLGLPGQRWDNIDASTAITHIQTLEGLQMAMDNHDATIGINWEVLKVYIDRVLEMQSAGII